MAFTTFKSLADLIKHKNIRYREEPFQIMTQAAAPAELKAELEFTFQKVAYDVSEAAICENLIYPVLRAAWKPFSDEFALWSHRPIELDGEFGGIPDYLVSWRSELGKIVFEAPFLAVVEAKRDDFTGGWAQCGMEMFAIQKLNQRTDLSVFGGVSNGEIWEFAELRSDAFILFRQRFDINQADALYQALQTVFLKSKEQVKPGTN